MNLTLKAFGLFLVIFFLGTVAGYFLPSQKVHKEIDAVYAIYDGKKILASDIDPSIQGDLNQFEKSIYNLKRKATEAYIKDKLSKQIEQNDDRGELKEIAISPAELSIFLKERNLDSAKLSKLQMDDILANLKLQKRKAEANKASDAEILKSPIQWKLPLPKEPLFEIEKASLPSDGSPGARVKVFYLGNFHCPMCKEGELRLAQLKEKYKDQIAIIYRFSLQEPDSSIVRAAAEASYCAHDQGQFWKYRDYLAKLPTILDTGVLISSAEKLNLDINVFKECLVGRKNKSILEKEIEEIVQLKIDVIPSFVIDGRLRAATLPLEEISVLIDQRL